MGGHRLVTFAACTSLIIKSAAGGTVHGDVALHSGPTMGQEITWHWWERCGCWFLCAQPRFGIISFCMNVAHIHFWQKKKKKDRLCLLTVCLERQRVHHYEKCHVLHHQNALVRITREDTSGAIGKELCFHHSHSLSSSLCLLLLSLGW